MIGSRRFPFMMSLRSESDNSDNTIEFTVSLNQQSYQEITVNYTTVEGTALAGEDFVAKSGQLTFAPGETTQTIAIPVWGDGLVEADESFQISLSNVTNALLATSEAIGMLSDDDAIGSAFNLGDSDNGITLFEAEVFHSQVARGEYSWETIAEIEASSGEAVQVGPDTGKVYWRNSASSLLNSPRLDYRIGFTEIGTYYVWLLGRAGGSTVETSDKAFVGLDGNLKASQSLSEVGADYSWQRVTLEVDSPGQHTLNLWMNEDGFVADKILITQDAALNLVNDQLSTISIHDVTQSEGDSSDNIIEFTVSLNQQSYQEITVNYTTVEGTAKAGEDFVAKSGKLTFAPGETTQTIAIAVWGDGLVEADESFQINLSNVQNAVLGDTEAIGTLSDDDSTSQAFSEVNFDDGIIVFEAEAFHAQVARSEYSWEIITEVEASAGQALQVWPDTGRVWGNGDFAALNSPRLDYRIDFSEIGTYYVWVLGRAGGSTVNTSDRAYVGLDGNLASAALLPRVTEDYGWKKVALEVDSVGQHTLNLWMNKDGFIADKILLTQNADLNLVNDRLSTISIHDVTQSESDNSDNTIEFTVSLNQQSYQEITVNYTTVEETAKAGEDFVAKSGQLTFAPGETTQTIAIPVWGDGLVEADESFQISLSNVTNALLATSEAIGMLSDDDAIGSAFNLGDSDNGITLFEAEVFHSQVARGEYSWETIAEIEASSGEAVQVGPDTGKVYWRNSASSLLNSPRLDYRIGFTEIGTYYVWLLGRAGGSTVETSDKAFVGLDGNLKASQSLSEVGADYSWQRVTLEVDSPGQHTLNLWMNEDGFVADKILITQDAALNLVNDQLSTISIHDVTQSEGDSSDNIIEFTVSLNQQSYQEITVNYTTVEGTAKAGEDFVAKSGKLTFAPGETTQTIAIAVWGDGLVEADESFQINLSNVQNAVLGDTEAIGTLSDDDSTSQAFSEVNFDDGIIVFEAEAFHAQVARSEYSWEIITEVEASAGQALQVWPDTGRVWGNGDFAALNSPRLDYRIDFSEIGTYYVWVLGRAGGSTVNTSDRAYVGLDGDLANAILLPKVGGDYSWKRVTLDVDIPGQHTLNLWMNKDGFIADKILITQDADLNLVNDQLSTISINDVTQTEADSHDNVIEFTVSLNQQSYQEITVNYATVEGTAKAGEDFINTNGIITFSPGETNQKISIPVLGDHIVEFTEDFSVILDQPQNAIIDDGQGQATLINDDIPNISINDITINEGNSGTGEAFFTLSLDKVSNQIVTVNYVTENLTAEVGEDYIANNGTATFTPGQTTQTIAVAIADDRFIEENESFQVQLSDATNAEIEDSQGLGLIVDDDSAGAGISEGNYGDGVTVIEAENFHAQLARGSYRWQTINETEASAQKAVFAGPDDGRIYGRGSFAEIYSPRLDYRIDFSEIGTYYVWVLGRAGGSTVDTSDRAFVGLDGSLASAALLPTVTEDYGWKKVALEVDSVGQHTLNLWMQEDGFVADKLLITQDSELIPTNIPLGDGLIGEYYNDTEFSDLALTRTDSAIDFNWGDNSPDDLINPNRFSVSWQGGIEAEYSETYTFTTRSDDGTRLWVNNQLLIDSWTGNGYRQNTGEISLTAGETYDIRLDYFDYQGSANAQLLWSSSNQTQEIIPQNYLYTNFSAHQGGSSI